MVTPSVEVIRPTAVETLALAAEEHALPAALQNDATLSVAFLEGQGVLAGGASGLYLVGTDTIELLDGTAVHALASDGARIIVASARGLLVWDGALADSSLNAELSGETVTSLATRGSDLYLGTATRLWLLAAGQLWAFDELAGATEIDASLGAIDVIVRSNAKTQALRRENDEWILRELSAEIGAARAVPGSAERIVSLEDGKIQQRTALEADGIEWRPISLLMDENDPGASGVEALAVDPVSGAVWAVDAGSLARLDHSRVSLVVRPGSMAAPQTISVTTDGAVWISDGSILRRFGNAGRPVSWSEDIAKFSANNCQRCHAPLKVGHPLDSYEIWAEEIDKIVTVLENRTMPQDGAALVGGTVDLVRQWREGGLRR